MKPALVLLLGAATTTYLTAQTWTQQVFPTPPAPRWRGAMAFDGVTNKLIMNGGLDSNPAQVVDETWSYNGSQWLLLNPAVASPPRWGHQIVRDTLRNRLITFGGRSPTIVGFADDTYTWNGSTWAPLATPNSPAPRYLYGMCYDQARDRVVLFGGTTATDSPNDTWEFDGFTWTEIATNNAPSSREDMVMQYDAQRATTVLYGGRDTATDQLLGDTWLYNGTDWQQVSPANSPSPRYRCASAYDSTRQRIVVYGGYDGQDLRTETYEYYAGGSWSLVASLPGTVNSTDMYAGFDPVRNKFVTFGGVGYAFSNETWEYAGAPTAQFSTFGQGCATSNGVPTMAASNLPQLGTNFRVVIGNLPAATNFVFVAEGFSATTWSGGALPYDLGAVGISGCSLLVSPEVLFGQSAALGNSLISLDVPNNSALNGLTYFLQAFALDPAAANGQGGITVGGRATIGT